MKHHTSINVRLTEFPREGMDAESWEQGEAGSSDSAGPSSRQGGEPPRREGEQGPSPPGRIGTWTRACALAARVCPFRVCASLWPTSWFAQGVNRRGNRCPFRQAYGKAYGHHERRAIGKD